MAGPNPAGNYRATATVGHSNGRQQGWGPPREPLGAVRVDRPYHPLSFRLTRLTCPPSGEDGDI